MALVLIGTACTGLGTPLNVALWVDRYHDYPKRILYRVLRMQSLFTVLLLLLYWTGYPIGVVLCIALSALYCIFQVAPKRPVRNATGSSVCETLANPIQSREVPRGKFAVAVIGMALIILVVALFRSVASTSLGLDAMATGFAVGEFLTFALVCFFTRNHVDFDFPNAIKAVVLCSALGVFFYTAVPGRLEVLSIGVIATSSSFITTVMLLLAINISDTSKASVSCASSVILGAGCLGYLPVMAIRAFIIEVDHSDIAMVNVVLPFVSLGLVFVSLWSLSERTVHELLWDGFPSQGQQPSRTDGLIPQKKCLDTRGLRERTLVDMVANYKLTPREKDVFCLLANGRSAPYIEEALAISRNTVNSHIKHIYRKMGISGRQELLSVIEAHIEGKGSNEPCVLGD